ncbi:MAG: glycosyltransferase [Cyanobacteria bacterium P01_G01_bin.54]
MMTGPLTPTEITAFQRQGFLGPFRAFDAEDIPKIRRSLTEKVLSVPSAYSPYPTHCRHLDSETVYQVYSAPSIQEKVRSLFGNNLILWSSAIFDKAPAKGRRVDVYPWHQDLYNWNLEPILNMTNITKDIVDILRIDPERIKVTYLASQFSGRESSKTDMLAIRSLKPYFLFVGTIEPRKNIETIIHAFNCLKQKHRLPHQLILVGRKGWKYKPIFDLISRSCYSSSIHYFNYVEDSKLVVLYKEADILLYPSWYEGFGLPILEAMTFKTPVITSNTSSLPEVAGDAALMIDPNNTHELIESILSIVEDEHLREKLIMKGVEHTKRFSWSQTALQVLDAYKTLV